MCVRVLHVATCLPTGVSWCCRRHPHCPLPMTFPLNTLEEPADVEITEEDNGGTADELLAAEWNKCGHADGALSAED